MPEHFRIRHQLRHQRIVLHQLLVLRRSLQQLPLTPFSYSLPRRPARGSSSPFRSAGPDSRPSPIGSAASLQTRSDPPNSQYSKHSQHSQHSQPPKRRQNSQDWTRSMRWRRGKCPASRAMRRGWGASPPTGRKRRRTASPRDWGACLAASSPARNAPPWRSPSRRAGGREARSIATGKCREEEKRSSRAPASAHRQECPPHGSEPRRSGATRLAYCPDCSSCRLDSR